MKKFFTTSFFVFIFFVWIFHTEFLAYAQNVPPEISLSGSWKIQMPQEIIELPSTSGKTALTGLLVLIQNILLKLVLPLVAVGCGIYIAYELFTADGDEAKLKQTWMAIVYSIVGILSIALSAFIVSLISGIKLV